MKTKQIFKSLSITLLALLGIFCLTGCSKGGDNSAEINNLTQQIESLEEEIGKLQEEIEGLKQSNSTTTEGNGDLNNELEAIKQEQLIANDILKAQYQKEEAWQKYVTARSNYLTNTNGVRNNLVLDVDFAGYTFETSFYKRPDGKYAILYKEAENDLTLIYQEDSSVYEFSQHEQDGVLVNTREEGSLTNLWNIDYSVFSALPVYTWEYYGLFGGKLENLTKDDITKVEVVENGNLKITFTRTVFFEKVYANYETAYVYQYNITTTKEIAPDGKMVSEKFDLYLDEYLQTVSFNTTFNYGEVDVAEITDYIAIANQTELEEFN